MEGLFRDHVRRAECKNMCHWVSYYCHGQKLHKNAVCGSASLWQQNSLAQDHIPASYVVIPNEPTHPSFIHCESKGEANQKKKEKTKEREGKGKKNKKRN
jgi:hypothetical protein